MQTIAFVFALFISLSAIASESFTVAFYNVENMFDHIDDVNVEDQEYTPNGLNAWTQEKSLAKILNIAKVIYKMRDSQGRTADVIGLAEVENEKVLKILTSIKEMKELGYQYIHFDSPDKRGIDVALLYRQGRFSPLSAKPIMVSIPGSKPTRDILEVKGVMGNENFVFYVNHWPSRSGGEAASMPFRAAAANILKQSYVKLLQESPSDKVIMMGDFNDNPNDKSLKNHLGAKLKLEEVMTGDIFNPYFALSRKGEGSNIFNDVWFNFDQILVSDQLVTKSAQGLKLVSTKVYRASFLFQQTGRFKGYPKRSYSEGEIGYSDHLPVYIEISK